MGPFVPLQLLAPGEHLAVLAADGHVQARRGGMHQQSITGGFGVHPAPSKRHPGGSRIGKPQIPNLDHCLTLSSGRSSCWVALWAARGTAPRLVLALANDRSVLL